MSGRHRDIGRKHLSGSVKRKSQDEKSKKDNKVISKTPKLTSFFLKTDDSTNETQVDERDSEEENENETEVLESSEAEKDLNPNNVNDENNPSTSAPSTSAPSASSTSNSSLDNTSVPEPYSTDIGTWPSVLDEISQEHWIETGSKGCRHNDADFSASLRHYETENRNRTCQEWFFVHTHKKTKEKNDRSWLCYSRSKGRLFCFHCKVLNAHSKFTEVGYNDWKNAPLALQQHEQSSDHRTALISFINRQCQKQCIDATLKQEISKEKLYWEKVLERIVEVVRFIFERGLAFRGENEQIGSEHNGNYLGMLELIAKFDPFLNAHIEKFANKGTGHVSYLGHRICDEFIMLLADRVKSRIIEEIKSTKYFSISLDSTPDISHVDQLTVIMRYTLPTGPVERFIMFLEMEGHTANQMLQRFIPDSGRLLF